MIGALATGDRFGDFEIIGVAGEGGMGIVYRATQLSLGRTVALKLIAPEIASQPDFRSRFEHESRLAASIDDPHVVSIYAAGEQDGRAYIAMQWIDGETLDQALRRGALAPDRAAAIIGQIAGALDAVHATGLIHRDIKPANILLRSRGSADHAYLTDFGVAKRTSVEVAGLTRTGFTVGTLGYMAPEQIQGERGDGRSDVYSLGCVLYEALTGHAPFERPTEPAVMWAHIHDPRPLPSTVRPELAGFDPVIERALAIDPAQRYATAGELGSAVAAAAVAPPVAAAPAPTPAPPTRAARGNEEPTVPLRDEPPPPPPRRRRGRALGLAAAGVVAIAAIAGGAIAISGAVSSNGTSSTTSGPTSSTTTSSTTSTTSSSSTTTSSTTNGGGVAAARSQITSVLDAYEAAYSAQDIDQLASLFTLDVTRHGLRKGGCSESSGINEVLTTYREQFDAGSGDYRLDGLSAKAISVSGATAVVPLTYTITPGGSGSVTFGLVQKNGNWLIDRVDASC